MSNAPRWRAFAVLAVVVGAAAMVASRPARLGLDLQGGTQIVLEARDTDRQKVDGDTLSRSLEVLRRRVDALGVTEPALQRSGSRRIIIELPGVADPDEARAVIGRTAQLAFHPVLAVEPTIVTTTTTTVFGSTEPSLPDPAEAAADQAPGELVLTDADGSHLRLGPAALTGEAVGTSRASLGGSFGGEWQVEVDFRGDGPKAWADLTGQAACAPTGSPQRRIAIVLDTEVISSPGVETGVPCETGIAGGNTVITGTFSEGEAKELALLIRAGALPVPVEVVEQRTIGPTLGDQAIRASVTATIIGASLTILYMVAYYRILGLLAAIALLAYGLVSYAVLIGMGATLTLPGIAGFVLAVGMAVDANVLVFERMKEEHAGGRTVRSSATAGFRNAWTAIADSNATTLLAALVLFFLASGAVRGFGITLSVGVVVSMFTALVLVRVLVELAVRSSRLTASPRLLGLEVGGGLRTWLAERGPDLLGRARLWFSVSAVVLVLAVAGIVSQGLTYGLEFSGGRLVEYDTERPIDLDQLRSDLARIGLPRAVVQASGEEKVTVRTARLSPEQDTAVSAAVEARGGVVSELRDEFVGPTIGDELRRKAVIALALALGAQLLYLAVRFRWTYGAAAVVAMFHDIVILLGVFAWLGKELDGVFLAALLTVIGYSINDSVVVFDRIREQRRSRARESLSTVANDACLQTLPRTINTGLGALFILVALYFLGGDTLTDFALALIVGIVVGTYSSVFTAAPLAVAFEGLTSAGSRPPLRPGTDTKDQATMSDVPSPLRPARVVPNRPTPMRTNTKPRPRKPQGKKRR